MTPEEMADRLRKNWPIQSTKAVEGGIRRGMYYAAKLALKGVQSTGIGRGSQGNYSISGLDPRQKGVSQIKAKHIRMFIKRVRLVHRGNQWQSGLEAVGFAALIEKGGHTKPHQIRARGRVLANPKTKQVFGKAVNHPGSRVPRQPYLGAAMTAAQPRIVAEIDKGFTNIGNTLTGPVRG